MNLTAKEQFDADYVYVRGMVLNRTMTLFQARVWIKLRGQKTIDEQQASLDNFHRRFWKTRADRDIIGIMEEED